MIRSEKAFDLNPLMEHAAEQEAAKYGVSPALSNCDQLLGFFINNVKMEMADAVRSYFAGGAGDAGAISSIINEFTPQDRPRRILEFAAGFGRITRHLVRTLPHDKVVSSDIHDDACDFLNRQIGVTAMPSTFVPEELNVGENYDFIFVFSLFSHLPDATFGRWLCALYSVLKPGGIMLFTTHGEAALRQNPGFFGVNFDPQKGFGYRVESDQEDISAEHYGTAVVTMPYVLSQISAAAPDAIVERYRSKSWFGLQDEWLLRRSV